MRAVTKRKIYAYECDIYSHLNHSRYFNYFEEARSLFFNSAKLPINYLTSNSFFVFVTNIQSDFRNELPLEEEITIFTYLEDSNPLKMRWRHLIFDINNNLCNSTQVETVFIKEKKPIRLPKELYKKLENFRMKKTIAVPVENEKLCGHFGHCKQFAVYNVEENKIVEEKLLDAPDHTPGAFPKFLNEKGVEVVIAGGMGHKAQDHFKIQKIELITGASEEDPKVLVNSYLEGKLKSKEVKCNHHH